MAEHETYRIGIDLGGTNIKIGIVNSSHKIIAHHSIKTLVQRSYQKIIQDMAEAVFFLLKQIRHDRCQLLFSWYFSLSSFFFLRKF